MPSPAEALFPEWGSPAGVAGFVLARVLLNAALVALLARWRGRESRTVVAGGTLATLSAVLLVAGLRRAVPVELTSVELVVQATLLVVVAVVVVRDRSPRRAVAAAVVWLPALLLGLVTVVLYGEAYVAP
jgi:hypothetical protein